VVRHAGALDLEVEGNNSASLAAAALARAVSPAISAVPTMPCSAPDSTMSPSPSSASQGQVTQACARCTLRVQARASSSHRFK
jgi:hypothetical protein